MSVCINLAKIEIALQQDIRSALTGSQVFVSKGPRGKSVLSSRAMEPSWSTGVAEPSSSSRAAGPSSSEGVAEPSCFRRSTIAQKPTALRMLFCTASFDHDRLVQITLPLNILFTATRSDVEFYRVTFGKDIALQKWMQHHMQWARALF
jgi:hypothetical protein